MSQITSIQQAIDYIEDHLRNKILIEEVAAHASYSLYHFHRVFSSVMGCSVKMYIRRRRLTCAAYDLNQTNKRIIDIAYEYGFESQEAFTRSFQQVFSISPGEYRKKRPYLEFVGPHEVAEIFSPDTKAMPLKPRVIERKPFYAIGMAKSQLEIAGTANREQTIQTEIPKLWDSFLSRMVEINGCVDPHVTYGIGRPSGGGIQFTYSVCLEVESEQCSVPDGMELIVVPGGMYAVFTHDGPSSHIPKLANYIYGSWLPTTEYQLNFGVEIEVYDERWKPSREGDIVMEICSPIRKAQAPCSSTYVLVKF